MLPWLQASSEAATGGGLGCSFDVPLGLGMEHRRRPGFGQDRLRRLLRAAGRAPSDRLRLGRHRTRRDASAPHRRAGRGRGQHPCRDHLPGGRARPPLDRVQSGDPAPQRRRPLLHGVPPALRPGLPRPHARPVRRRDRARPEPGPRPSCNGGRGTGRSPHPRPDGRRLAWHVGQARKC